MGRKAKDEKDKALVVAVSITDVEVKKQIKDWQKDGSVIISKKFEQALKKFMNK